MTDRPIHELAQVAAALARNALRIHDAHTKEERTQAAHDQQTLMADLDRAELEVVAQGLAALVAEVTEAFAKARAGSAQRLLERIVQRFAAEAAKEPPDVGDHGGND